MIQRYLLPNRAFFPVAAALVGVLTAGCGSTPQVGDAAEDVGTEVAVAQEVEPVIPGLEVLLRDSTHLVRGRRVGFLTNQTAVTSEGTSGIDLLHESPDVQLVALYGPEHGLRGGIEGGVVIEDERDPATGLPVFSLYGQVQRPTPEMLQGVDVLLFDMQDIGARPYTFVWTMAMAMEAAAAEGVDFIVLDRPNPITGEVEGPLMDMEMRDVAQAITGYFPVPLRHGQTVGEIARYINEEYDLGVNLTVVPAAGWDDSEWFDETGLPWINPSPNIRSLEAALNYSGLVLFEATTLSVGRGTDAPFSYLGAPWLDAERVLETVQEYDLPGVSLTPTALTPTGDGYIPYLDEEIQAIHFEITDREEYRPVWTALVLLHEIRRVHPEEFRILNAGFTQMIGSFWAREALDSGVDPEVIWARWERDLRAWEERMEPYSIY